MNIKVEFNAAETATLRGLIRNALRKTDRDLIKARGKFGSEFNEESAQGRVTRLEGLYHKLGGEGDPREHT